MQATYILPGFFQGHIDIGTVADVFLAGLTAYPDVIAYTLINGNGDLVYARGVESSIGESAVNVSLQWVKQYWTQVVTLKGGLYVPVIDGTHTPTFLGAIYPVYVRNELAGVLAVMIDIQSVAERSILPLDTHPSETAFVLDGRGTIIYRTKPKTTSITNIAELENPGHPGLIRRLLVEKSGSDTYALNGLRGGHGMIAWKALQVGEQTLIVSIAADSQEAYQMIEESSRAHAVLSLALVPVMFGFGLILLHGRRQISMRP